MVTRQEIGEHLYDFEQDVSPNAVEAAVARLRRKLDLEGSPALLHTRRGLGYVLGVVGKSAVRRAGSLLFNMNASERSTSGIQGSEHHPDAFVELSTKTDHCSAIVN